MRRLLTMMIVLFALVTGIEGISTITFPSNPFATEYADAAVKWVNSSRCSGGGYYRDTSNDGYSYNNANTLGYND